MNGQDPNLGNVSQNQQQSGQASAPQGDAGYQPMQVTAQGRTLPVRESLDTQNTELIRQLQVVKEQEMANRAQPQPVQQGLPPAESQEKQEEDPLAKLLNLVKGPQGAVDKLKVKRLFVVSNNKISNEALNLLVDSCRQNGMEESEIIKLMLLLDRKVEQGELKQEFFDKLAEGGV